MEKRIDLERRGRKPEEIDELNLDNCRSTSIEGLTDEFVNLKSLSLIGVGLTSLKGFPKLPNLQRLELSDNRISNGLNLLQTSPKLTTLNLSGNRIKDLETLEPLKDFEHLKNLDLFNNDVTKVENYRDKTFKLIPSLKCLDGFDATDQEIEEIEDSDQEGDSVNGNEEDSDVSGEEFEGGEDEDDEDIEEDEIGLEHVYKDNLEEESEGDDYDGEGSEEEEFEYLDDEEESFNKVDGEGDEADGEEEDSTPRIKRRKHEGEEEVN